MDLKGFLETIPSEFSVVMEKLNSETFKSRKVSSSVRIGI